jgi:hypothetical protein
MNTETATGRAGRLAKGLNRSATGRSGPGRRRQIAPDTGQPVDGTAFEVDTDKGRRLQVSEPGHQLSDLLWCLQVAGKQNHSDRPNLLQERVLICSELGAGEPDHQRQGVSSLHLHAP